MLQILNAEELGTRLAEALVVAVVAYCFRLSHRLTKAEARLGVLDSVMKELASVSAVADQLTSLMTKVDTLLETGLKRIDMLEKHVFKM